MPRTRKSRRLVDAYAFPGFRPQEKVRGVFGDPKARQPTAPEGHRYRRDLHPQAAILFDKFHVLRHLGEALERLAMVASARLGK